MPAPASYNFVLVKGDTLTRTLRVYSGGAAVDLSGSHFYMQVRAGAEEDTTLILNANAYFTVTSSAATLTLSNAVTAALAAGTYYYTLVWKDSSGANTTVISGLFRVLPRTTTVTS